MIIIDNERYGVRSEFETLAEANAAIRACGSGFETTELAVRADGMVLDEDGCEVGREVKTEMTAAEAKQWVLSHGDGDDLDEAELEAAFTAIFERAPDDEEREQGLWSHLCAAV